MENKNLLRFIENLLRTTDQIEDKRKRLLGLTADLIKDQISEKGQSNIVFICTHNSRRSQLAEAWLIAAAQYFNINNLHAFSGGTEATSFNIRMVVALRESSFHLHSKGPITNPHYHILALRETKEPHVMYSKVYDDATNPKKDFIALMVCDQADQNCPVVSGAAHKIALPYTDPKELDDTPMEYLAYTDKVTEIGREILYMISEIGK